MIQKHGFNQHGMGWRKGFLNKRYSIFLKHLKFNDKKILDYGTGVGSFYSFLVKKKILVKKYNALEINDNLIKYLKKKFKKNFYVTSNRKYFLKTKSIFPFQMEYIILILEKKKNIFIMK